MDLNPPLVVPLAENVREAVFAPTVFQPRPPETSGQLYAVAIATGIFSSILFSSGGPSVLWKKFVTLSTYEDKKQEEAYSEKQGEGLIPMQRTLDKLFLFGLFPASVYMFHILQRQPLPLAVVLAAYNWAVMPAVVLFMMAMYPKVYLKYWEGIVSLRFLLWTVDWCWRYNGYGLAFRDIMLLIPLYKLAWGLVMPRLLYQVPLHLGSTALFMMVGVQANQKGAPLSELKGAGLLALMGLMHIVGPLVLAWDKETRARMKFESDWEETRQQMVRAEEERTKKGMVCTACVVNKEGETSKFCQACDNPFMPLDIGQMMKRTKKNYPKVDLPPPPPLVPELDVNNPLGDMEAPRKEPRVKYHIGADGMPRIHDIEFSDSDVEYDEDKDVKMHMTESDDESDIDSLSD